MLKNRSNRKLWKTSRKAAKGPRVLLGTSMGDFQHVVTLDYVLALSLTLRNARVEILLCDQAMPACQMTKHAIYETEEFLKNKDRTPRCSRCHRSAKNRFGDFGLPIHWFGRYLSRKDKKTASELAARVPFDEISQWTWEGMKVGEHAHAGALRYFARGNLDQEPQGEAVLRRYLRAALLTVFAFRKVLQKHGYEVVCLTHGIYVPQGLLVEVCKKMGVRVVTWNPSYRDKTFIFSHEDTYHHTMISEPVSAWENMTWDEQREAQTLAYLESRWHGTKDWIWFHHEPVTDLETVQKEVGIDLSKPTIGMLTSVVWDAQLHYESNAFKDMMDWVLKTVEYFSKRTDLQLLIRVHPAEIHGLIPSRQKAADEIRLAFPNLPANIFVVAPESPASTYALMEHCNAVIIYNTKTGIEISAMGIPVVVAGEAWIRNKGFCVDVNSAQHYLKVLDALPFSQRLAPDELLRAKKYAHHFFFRRMIEVPFIQSMPKNKFKIQLENLTDLYPGRFPGLDVICAGIVSGKPFFAESPLAESLKEKEYV
ncbi:capsule biosynthesis protein [Omnitrophica bacterium]|nr:capsule biosynthesis protein [Candidatus Omnitrophota bacterium]